MTLSPEQLGAYGTAAVFGLMAGYERFINRKKALKLEANQETLSEAKAFKERGDLMLKQAEEYRELLEKEYLAHQATRDFHHSHSEKAQAELSKCNEKIQELQSRTDLTKIEGILINQTNSLLQIGNGITELLRR